MSGATLPAAVRRSLRETFGIKRLREGQRVIRNVLCAADTLAIMPTGAGKSLCYNCRRCTSTASPWSCPR